MTNMVVNWIGFRCLVFGVIPFLLCSRNLHADEFEKPLEELSIKEEARRAGAQVIYRMMVLPSRIGTGHAFSIKVPVNIRKTNSGPAVSAIIILKIRKYDGSIVEESRNLKFDELSSVVGAICDQEVFSLPRSKDDETRIPGTAGRMLMDNSLVKLERYDSETKQASVLVRPSLEGTPVGNIGAVLGNLAKSLAVGIKE